MKFADPRPIARSRRAAACWAVSLACSVTGCSQPDTSIPPDEPSPAAAAGAAPLATPAAAAHRVASQPAVAQPPSLNAVDAAARFSSDVTLVPPPPARPDGAADAEPTDQAGAGRSVLTGNSVLQGSPESSADAPQSVSVAEVAGGTLQLPADLTAPQLVDFLGRADKELFRVANQVRSATDSTAAVGELRRVAGLKLQAAERLLALADLPSEQIKAAQRGKLQSLSHLAAMGDIAAANQLKAYATDLSKADDPRLMAESQLVLIGFALEKLQSGGLKDPSQVVDLVTHLADSSQPLQMAALMAMGQARGVLQQYGYSEQARQVGAKILDAFAAHPDPQIASLALQMAGSEPPQNSDAP